MAGGPRLESSKKLLKTTTHRICTVAPLSRSSSTNPPCHAPYMPPHPCAAHVSVWHPPFRPLSGPRLEAGARAAGTNRCHPRCSQSHKLHGHDPPYCHQEVAWGRVSPACSRRARRRTAPWLEPLSYAGPAQPVGSVPCHYFPLVRLAIRATCAPVRPGRMRPGAFVDPAAP